MKNFEARNYVAMGLSGLSFKGMEPKSGLKVYRICKELDRVAGVVDTEQQELIKKTLGDGLEKYMQYQEWLSKSKRASMAGDPEPEKPEGLITAEEYDALYKEFEPVVLEMLNAEADISLVPLTFGEWMEVAARNADLELFRNETTGACLHLSDTDVVKLLDGVLWKEED